MRVSNPNSNKSPKGILIEKTKLLHKKQVELNKAMSFLGCKIQREEASLNEKLKYYVLRSMSAEDWEEDKEYYLDVTKFPFSVLKEIAEKNEFESLFSLKHLNLIASSFGIKTEKKKWKVTRNITTHLLGTDSYYLFKSYF